MADVTYSVSAQLNKDSLSQSFVAGGVTADCSQSGFSTVTVAPGTNAAGTAAISTATLTSVGLFFARNLSTVATASVSFGQLSGGTLVPTVSLLGGEASIGRLAAGNYAAQANVTGTRLLISIIEG